MVVTQPQARRSPATQWALAMKTCELAIAAMPSIRSKQPMTTSRNGVRVPL